MYHSYVNSVWPGLNNKLSAGKYSSPVNNHLQVTKELYELSHFRHVSMCIYNQHWWGPKGKGWHDFCRTGTAFDCCNFPWWGAEEVWGTCLRLPSGAVLHHLTILLISHFLLRLVLSVLRVWWDLLYPNPIKCTAFYSYGLFWKTSFFAKSRTLGTFLCGCFPCRCSRGFFLRGHCNLDVFPLYGICF